MWKAMDLWKKDTCKEQGLATLFCLCFHLFLKHQGRERDARETLQEAMQRFQQNVCLLTVKKCLPHEVSFEIDVTILLQRSQLFSSFPSSVIAHVCLSIVSIFHFSSTMDPATH